VFHQCKARIENRVGGAAFQPLKKAFPLLATRFMAKVNHLDLT